jgi:hypothetical protein
MKNKILILLAALVLASCTEVITITPPPANVRIYNSAWQVIRADRIESRNITSTADLEAYVEEYNAANIDDQLFLIEGEAEVPIEQAPNADAWIVDATSYDIVEEYLSVPRVQLETDRELWRLQLRNVGNALLFVDRIPPRPEPPAVVPDYEKYACYLIDETGAVIFETHCEDWQEAGYPDIAACFAWYSWAVRQDALSNAGWSYVTGRLYP